MDSVLTVASAAAAGVSRHAIAHQVSRGRWLRLLPGVYLTHGGTPTPVERAAAALLFAGEGAVLSGSHALQRYAVRSAPLSVAKILVLTPMSNARRSAGFVFVRRTHLAPAQPVRIGRLAVAPITRAVIDTCLGLRSQRTVRAIVAEVVQRRRCSAADLAAELAVSGRRGSAFCRAAILEVGAGAWSAPECEVGELFRRAHLPGFEQNVDVCDEAGNWLACGDVVWRQLRAILEVDSREHHADPESWERTLQRHNVLSSAGWSVLHYPPRLIRDDGERVVRQVRRWLHDRARELGLEPASRADDHGV